jgi:large subunit ribosomal protein L3
MLNTILGTKEKMGAAFVEDTRVPVTWVKAGPCVVTQIKTLEHDGYWAAQIGFGSKKAKNISKPLAGHLKKSTSAFAKASADKQKSQPKADRPLDEKLKTQNLLPRYLREIRTDAKPSVKVGELILVSDLFKKGDVISVSGISKGKGFAGVVKRWHFAGGPKTHGQSDRQRAPGSIGQGTTPGRVFKGKHMAGRMGGERVTIKNLVIVDVDTKGERIAISGALPGSRDSLLIIKKIGSGKLEELVEDVPEVQVQVEEVSDEAEKEKPKVESENGAVDGQEEEK